MMTEFRGIFALIWYLFLPAFSASQFHESFCTNNSLVDTRKKPEGNIVFPLTTSNYTGKICNVLIRSPLDSKTELTLVNLRQTTPYEQCFENSIEINEVQDNSHRYTFCRSVGSVEKITLRSTIRMIYKASFRNEMAESSTKTAISVHYKRLNINNSTKVCRHVLTAQRDTFKTSGYPDYPLQGECEWVINTEKGEGISLEFQILNDQNLNCDNNFIEVRQGESIEAPLLVKICKSAQRRSIKSSSNKLWIRVKSSTTQPIGFQATYHICEVITANKQLNFKSPMKSCQTWNLTAPPGHIAALSFSNFYVVSTASTSCKGNVLEVWDGKTKTAYCNLKSPPSIILSKGQKLVVTYRSIDFDEHVMDIPISFQASFTSIFPSSYKTNCFVTNKELRFKCNNKQVIPCEWQCDGAMQCSDNSDESPCSDMQARWHKLQVFVIVMGSICASTVIFCVGLVCFRKCIIHDRSSTRHSRRLSITDQSPLTPNVDLPSPPPSYFTNQDEEAPASVIRGTYFFGDEFSQSGIHSASLFGIPPPRYRSTESLHQSTTETRSIWQRSISSIPLVPTDSSRNSVIIPLPEEDPPDYDSLSADKDEQIMTNSAALNNEASLGPVACVPENPASSSNECIANDNNLDNDMAIELQTRVPATTSLTNELIPGNQVVDIDVGIMNPGATLNM